MCERRSRDVFIYHPFYTTHVKFDTFPWNFSSSTCVSNTIIRISSNRGVG
jgi:hypothetical protein